MRIDTNRQWTTYRILDATIDNPDLADPLNIGATGAAEGKGFILWGDTSAAKIEWDEVNDRLLTTSATIRMGTDDKLEFRDANQYIHSDAAGDLMLSALTNLNLAIGGTDEISINNTTVTIGSNFLSVDNSTDTTSTVTGSIHTDGGIGVAKRVWIGTGLIMATGEIDMTTAGTGSYGLRLRPNVADALSITRGAIDMVVFNSATPSITITPATTITGNLTLSSNLSVDGTTDTSSTITGSIHTDGGIGVAKRIWLGTSLIMAGGEIDMTTATSGTYGIRLKTNSADALSITRGATDMMVFNAVAPSITITPATTITGALTLSSNLTVAGFLSVDSATDTTSTVTGSIHTDGGIGVAKRVWIGTGLVMDTGEIDMTGALSGSYGLRLRPNSADALSITGGATDMMVFKTTAPSRITITPVTSIVGQLRAEGGLYVAGTVTLPAGAIVGTHIADNTIAPGHMRSDLGADYGPGGVTSITVVNGMVTACS